MIHISCHSENFGIHPPDETFAFIKRLGFDRVDVASRSLIPQGRIIADAKKEARLMRDLADRHELVLDELFLGPVELAGQGVSPESAFASEEYHDNFAVICAFARDAGFASVMGAAGMVTKEIGETASFDNAAKTLARMADIAENAGIMLTVEPSRNSLLSIPAVALEMAKRVPKLRYTLDLLHYQVNGHPQQESMKLLPYTGHMHARQAAVGWIKCPYEYGEIDYDALMKRLRGMSWSGTICMEYWCGEAEKNTGISAIDQNILMRHEIKRLIKKYWGY